MFETTKNYLIELIKDLIVLDFNTIIFFLLIAIAVILLDFINNYAAEKKRKSGIEPEKKKIKLQIVDSETFKVKTYISNMQGISGKPDAIISENGNLIPIEVKPTAKKIRDRYVGQLLVYMRLIEEFEGKKPPYGYLILGKNSRKVKIYNTQERQAWLQKYIDNMNLIIDEELKTKASPQKNKCKHCLVSDNCNYKFIKQAP